MSLEERLGRIAGLRPAGMRPRRPPPCDPAAVLPEPVSVRTFPFEHRHGTLPLGAVLAADTRALAPLAQDLGVAEFAAREIVFLDTETTSLGGGAGCLVFLVGLGRFAADRFVVEQHLLVRPPEERAFLERIRAALADFRGVATFFGRSFDRPRLEDRFAFHRMDTRLPARPHADLHTLARRLWGAELPDCRLRTVEERILGFVRHDDLPGALCPEAYRAFLEGDDRWLAGVLEHNRNDILSLAVLAHAVCLEARDPATIRGRLAVARGLAAGGDPERALALLRAAADDERRQGGGAAGNWPAARALGDWLKRAGRRAEAQRHWQEMAARGAGGIYPHTELAKLHEHHTGDLARALEWTLVAARLDRGEEAAALAHRAARLRRKRGELPAGAAALPGAESPAPAPPAGGLASRLGLERRRGDDHDAIAHET
ncbi:MAG: ribonuclease H-like domain-containing protein [Planctomycetes bacterium]|nr:ribonuclease H-like domain-containing protein [Planctomycetota bacterium]